MAGMNPGFAAYLAKKKAATKGSPATGDAKKPVEAKLKLNAKHASIQQRAKAY